MRDLDKILDDEEILWEGVPNFWPFVMKSFATTIFGIFWLFIVVLMGDFLGPFVLLLPHFWIGVVLVLGGPIYAVLVYKYVYYTITDKRVIIQRGIIGRDFTSIEYDKIQDVDVRVDFLDKVLGPPEGSGSINIYTASTFRYSAEGREYVRPNSLSNIKDPYNVFKLFKKVSHAVKTDINFPNKYRPKNNPGYGTEYKPKTTKKK